MGTQDTELVFNLVHGGEKALPALVVWLFQINREPKLSPVPVPWKGERHFSIMYNRFLFYARINPLSSPAVFLGYCTVFSLVMNKCI